MFVEPSADMRVAAAQIYQLFAALVDQGFTRDEAMSLVSEVVVAGCK